jgi:hypothetical protein
MGRHRVVGAVATLVGVLASWAGVANAAGWSVAGSATATVPFGSLGSVSCLGITACTAVGNYFDSAGNQVTLAERWNGTRWAIQPTPNPTGASNSVLSGVSCARLRPLCTAVGNYVDAAGNQVTLAERWNGTRWAIQPTPNPTGASNSALGSVSCTSSTACMAVGAPAIATGFLGTLAERWNGKRWEIQPTLNPTGSPASYLFGVSCTSRTTCTAVGTYDDSAASVVPPLAERWNGTSWVIQPTPFSNADGQGSLSGVSCTSATACTAVGYLPNLDIPLVERWDGTRWVIQPTPDSGLLAAVSCTSTTACTAVGNYFTPALATLAERWNGTNWEIQPTP